MPRKQGPLSPLREQGPSRDNAMVFAVQCPNPKCRKFMLVEEKDRGKSIPCLICKGNIKVGSGSPPAAPQGPKK